MRLTRTVAVIVVACCTAGCTREPAPAPPPPVPSAAATSNATASPSPAGRPAGTASLDCDSPIGVEPSVAAPYGGSLDAVALDTSVVQAGDAAGTAPHRLFAKTGLLVHSGRASTLTVPASWASRVAIAWGNHAAEWTGVLHIPACPAPASHPGAWLAFPGGLSLDRAACVPLEVSADGRTTTVSLSVGARCPG
ncbi:hypothetical protein ACQP2F_20760 [Actinoplanes sp. CA-030573]|uniref:hypothetical protein n=1 Tax=Actinoplanes sp. CA-030573 TaxID=3239898 RepID=UPI003D8EEE6A